jgi:hypothetical protein
MLMRSNTTQSLQQIQIANDIIELQKSAGRALLVVIEVGATRMEGWKFTILDCVAQCWVSSVDVNTGGIGKLCLFSESPVDKYSNSFLS